MRFNWTDDEEIEETESRDKICRSKVDTFLNNSMSGKAIEIIVAFLSLLSSLAFIVLTSYDLRYLNPCCDAALKKFAQYVSDTEAEIVATGDPNLAIMSESSFLLIHGECPEPDPPCYEYYHNNRMPQLFDLIDTPVCIIYAIHYFLNLYIAVNRCQFFIEPYNLT